MVVSLSAISYPAFVWYEGYIFLAEKPLNLCIVDRSALRNSLQRAHSGKQHLLDAEGRYYDVVDWIPTTHRLFRTINAVPTLANERQLSLSEFKKKLRRAIESRYRYDLDSYPAHDAARQLETADSFRAALDAVPWPKPFFSWRPVAEAVWQKMKVR